MTLSPNAIALIAVLVLGYLLAVGIGSVAYFANEKTIKR
ncbi:MAG: endonuclease [Waterburya sp.]